jgi:hypothetical protein
LDVDVVPFVQGKQAESLGVHYNVVAELVVGWWVGDKISGKSE